MPNQSGHRFVVESEVERLVPMGVLHRACELPIHIPAQLVAAPFKAIDMELLGKAPRHPPKTPHLPVPPLLLEGPPRPAPAHASGPATVSRINSQSLVPLPLLPGDWICRTPRFVFQKPNPYQRQDHFRVHVARSIAIHYGAESSTIPGSECLSFQVE
jgi:hypothetical protein